MIEYALLPVLSYLIGAIPFGFLVVKVRRGIDLRTVGSGNLGATNAARILGARWFAVVFGFDFLKGFGPAFGLGWLARAHLGAPEEIALLYGAAAMIGHIFPVYLGFVGGKGVATAAGAVMGITPAATGIAAGVFLVTFLPLRYVSLGSMVAAVSLPIAYALLHREEMPDTTLWVLVALAALVVVKHRTNIVRLTKGTESKAIRRKPAPAGEESDA